MKKSRHSPKIFHSVSEIVQAALIYIFHTRRHGEEKMALTALSFPRTNRHSKEVTYPDHKMYESKVHHKIGTWGGYFVSLNTQRYIKRPVVSIKAVAAHC